MQVNEGQVHRLPHAAGAGGEYGRVESAGECIDLNRVGSPGHAGIASEVRVGSRQRQLPRALKVLECYKRRCVGGGVDLLERRGSALHQLT